MEIGSFDYFGLRDLYARAAIVVVPLADVDFQAGVTTILEAMAMGKPVIVTHSQGQTDVVEDRRMRRAATRPARVRVSFTRQLAQELGHPVEPTGLYVPPADPAALRQAIVYLLDHPEERARLGAAGRRTVEAVVHRRPVRPAHARAGGPRRITAVPQRRSAWRLAGIAMNVQTRSLRRPRRPDGYGHRAPADDGVPSGTDDPQPSSVARSAAGRTGASRRFAILVPAHNEEALIGRLLRSLQQLDYPADRAHVYVVADNCD